MSAVDPIALLAGGRPPTNGFRGKPDASAPPSSTRSTSPTVIDARQLLETTLREPNFAVPGILPEGLTLLAGKPKTGKSWFALGIAVAVASGGRALGRIPVDRGDVLYLALEDTQRRLQQRLKAILRDEQCPSGLALATTWQRTGAGGTEDLLRWLDAHKKTRLVITDTLARIRPQHGRNGNLYEEDYAAISALKRVADHAGASFLVVTHTRKMASEDPLDNVSGTNGQTGAADATLVLKRERAHRDAVLFMTGRDIEEREIGIRWDPTLTSWTLRGDAGEVEISDERAAVLSALRAAQRPMTPMQTATFLGKARDPIKNLMWRMGQAGQLTADKRGRYSLPDNPTNQTNLRYPDTEIPGDGVARYPGFAGLSHAHAREAGE